MKILIEEWKTVIQTQMHFNEMIMRMRSMSISIYLAIFGWAAYSLQYEIFLEICSLKFHASVLITLVGLAMFFSVFLVDFFYYDKMLRGAVNKSYEIDDAFKDKKIYGTQLFGLSTAIKNGIGKKDISMKYIKLFYIIPLLMGTLFMLLVFFGYKQIPEISNLTNTYNSTVKGTG